MPAKLTLRSVTTATPDADPYEIRDADIAGLLLRVQPSGVKTFYCEIARGVRIKLGRFPVMTVEGARTQAKRHIGEYAKTGERPQPKHKDSTFGAFLRDRYSPWFTAERKTGARTIATIEAQFANLLDKPLSDVTAWAVEKHKAARLKSGTMPATVNRDLVRIKAAMAKAVEWKLIAENPLRSVKRAKGDDNSRVRFLSATEEKALRKALSARDAKGKARRAAGKAWRTERGVEHLPAITDYCDHLTPMVLLALNTGLRRGELTAITWADVNLLGKLLTVRGGYAKSGKPRHIPLNAEALDVLKRYRKLQGGVGRLFPILDAKKAWGGVVTTAGLADFRFHDLRHTFASNLVMAGVDLNTVRELLGHADITMTLRYSHLAPEHKAAAVEKLIR